MKLGTGKFVCLTLALLCIHAEFTHSSPFQQSSGFQNYLESDDDFIGQEDQDEGDLQFLQQLPDLEPQQLKDRENTNEQASFVPQLEFQERLSRQKNCKWTGCHKLPLGKQSSCGSGTFLETYKPCNPRGSGQVDVLCCN